MLKELAVVALAVGAQLAHADTYTTLTLPTLNADIRGWTDGATYNPIFPGTQTFNGVPFALAADASGNTVFMNGSLDITVGVYGVTSAYTLINSAVGAFGANNGSVEFFGTSGYYKVDLVQGMNVRDHYDGFYNNTIDNVTAVAAFNVGPGRARLDQQIYLLPTEFATQTLETIRFNGVNAPGNGGQAFIAAATVAVVPEPETFALMLAGLGVLGWASRRRR